MQIGVFLKPTQPDRTIKFVRAAYVWLVIACGICHLQWMNEEPAPMKLNLAELECEQVESSLSRMLF